MTDNIKHRFYYRKMQQNFILRVLGVSTLMVISVGCKWKSFLKPQTIKFPICHIRKYKLYLVRLV